MKNIVILISGGGSNMAAIVHAAEQQGWAARHGIRVAAVLSNRADAGGLSFARERGIATAVLDHKAYPSREAFDEALAQAVDDRRVMAHSFDATEQERIGDFAISGPWRSPANADQELGVFLNDGTGSKMSYFLAADVAVRPDFCTGEQQQFTGRLTLTSDTPDDVRSLPDYVTGRSLSRIPAGEQLVIVYVTAPEGGSLSQLSVDGRKVDQVFVRELAGRQVAEFASFIKPDAQSEITWRLRTAPTDELDLTVTPGVRSTESRTLDTAC